MRKPSRTFTLTRTLPDGSQRVQTGIPTLQKVGNAAFYVLVDNRATTDRGAAARVAEEVERVACGAPVEAYGYTFVKTLHEIKQ